MIKISKEERDILVKKCGLTIGVDFEPDICRTYSNPKHWYMCEKKKNLKLLEQIRNGNKSPKVYTYKKNNKNKKFNKNRSNGDN